MKIIKKNNRIVCKLCKSELEFELNDVMMRLGHCNEKYIICPVCKSTNCLNEYFDKSKELDNERFN